MRIFYVAGLVLSSVVAVAQLKPVMRLEQTGGEVTCIDFSADGRFFFSGSLDTYVTVWKTINWTKAAEITPAPPPTSSGGEHQDDFRGLSACAVEPDVDRVLIASGGDSVATYSLQDGHQYTDRNLNVNYRALAVSADGQEVAVGSGTQLVLYSAAEWRRMGTIALRGVVGTLRYAPKGRLLAVAIEHGGVQLWDTRRKALVRTLSDTGDSAQINFSPDGRTLAAAVWGVGQQTGVKVWDVSTGKQLTWLAAAKLDLKHKNDVWAVAFSPDGKSLVSGDTNGNVTVWNTADWESCSQLTTSGLYEVAVSPDGRWLASGGGDRDAFVWDLQELTKNCH
jgi:WD40 repeat protein